MKLSYNKMILLILFLSISVFFQPSQSFAGNKNSVALVMKALSNPFFNKMEQGAKSYAEENDISLDVFGLKNETDVAYQISILESLILRKYGAIVIAPADSKKLIPICKKAIDQGIVIINIDNPLNHTMLQENNMTIPFVGSDNREGGNLLGKYIKRQLKGKGNVVVIEGIREVENAELRKIGFTEAVKKESSIEVIASESANWNTEEAFSVTMNLLEKFNNIDAIFCANDSMALGALQALDITSQTKKILIAGYDNIDSVRNEIQNSRIKATIEQHPELMGEYGVMLAWESLKGAKIPNKTATPLDLITYEHFNKKVGLSISNLKNPFFISLVQGAKKAAQLYGMELIIEDAENKDSKQLVDIVNLHNQKVDVLIINPTNAEAVIPGIEMARMSNIPVITVDRKASGGDILCHVASDNIEGGRMAARLIAKYLKNKGNIIEIEGIPGASAAYERGFGFNDELKKFINVKVITREVANFDRNEAINVITKLISNGINFDAVFAHNDNMILGVMDVLSKKNYATPKILIGFDAIKEAVRAVNEKRITATIAQQPNEMGNIAIRTAARFFRGGKISTFIPVNLSMIK